MGKKIDRQQRALERLTAQIGDRLETGKSVSFSQRMEFNKLRDTMAKAGRP